MSTNSLYYFLCFFIAFAVISGCKSDHRPAGLPKLMPCEITVIDVDGTPLTGAGVTLEAVDNDIPWAAIGTTDENGVASIAVNNQYKGAPAGKYKVVLNKVRGFDKTDGKPNFPPHVFVSMQDELAYFINPIYTQRQSSPFELEVVSGQPAAATFTLEKSPKDK